MKHYMKKDYANYEPAPALHRNQTDSHRTATKGMRSSKDDETLSLAETLNDRLPGSVIENSQNELLPNREAVDDLHKRVEDWKGHCPAAFRDLRLHGKLEIVSSTQSAIPKMVGSYTCNFPRKPSPAIKHLSRLRCCMDRRPDIFAPLIIAA